MIGRNAASVSARLHCSNVTSTPIPTPICSAISARVSDSGPVMGYICPWCDSSGLTSSAAATRAMSSIEIGASTTDGYGSRTVRVALICSDQMVKFSRNSPGPSWVLTRPDAAMVSACSCQCAAPDSATTYSTPAFLTRSRVASSVWGSGARYIRSTPSSAAGSDSGSPR